MVINVLVCYRPPSQHEEVNRRRRRTNALLASITIVFFVCWSPLVIFCFIYDFAKHLIPTRPSMAQYTYTLTLLFGMLTPIANPILYSCLNENFRQAVKKKFLLKCWMFQAKNQEFEMVQQVEDKNISDQNETLDVEGEREIVSKRRAKVSVNQVDQVFNSKENEKLLVEKQNQIQNGNGVQNV